jgi:amino acid adenylation domain-containing protein/non-ribosomal peptide synthase protein (TIGR01720 family)
MSSGFWVADPTDINRLVPFGAPGELLIEGPLLARGYLNDAAKTAASFVTDPAFIQDLGLSPGRRMYRSGDIVQQNAGNSLTMIGRRDNQVKIRGQRVEIGEIEYHMGNQTSVQDAVVLYIRQGPLAGRLVATVVLGQSSTTTAVKRHQYASDVVQCVTEDKMEAALLRLREIRQSVSQQVMHYMVPSVWIPLQAVPVNPSGKTDRLALTRWVQSLSQDEIAAVTRSESEDANYVPATDVERQLRQIWSEVLGVSLGEITQSTNFFSLGGDSIAAMQIVSASRSRGIFLTVRKILESQTIPQLASQAEVETTEDADQAAQIPDEAFALSPIQQLYFDDISADGLRADDEHRYNQSVVVRPTRRLEVAELAQALDVTVGKHAMLRARFRRTEHGWEQWIEKELAESYRLHAHTTADTRSIQRTIARSQATLDLEQGPVFTADLIEGQDSNKQVLHLAAHHLVIDLVSWRILVRDIEELLTNHKLPNPRSLSFPVWLERQRTSLGNTQISPIDTLPVTIPAANWEYWGLTLGQTTWDSVSSIRAQCDSHTTSLLFGSANAALKTEPVEILLAALFLSFKKSFNDRSVPAVFTEGHGREASDETDLSDTVGWFTTMTPIHVPIEADTRSAVDVLRQVKDQRRRIPGHGAPYFGNRFLSASGREVFAHHSPAEIIFNYTGRFQQAERENALFRLVDDDDDDDQNEGTASEVGGLVRILAALDVSVTVEADILQVNVRFSRQARHQEAIQQWITAYVNTVSSLVQDLTTMAPVATATDFQLMDLSDSDMEVVENQYLPAINISSTSEIEDILPCSPLQQGILLTQLQSPSTYCIRQTCRILPSNSLQPVSAERLLKAWSQVIARHSILRTILLEPLAGQERFIQIVLKQPDISIVHMDGILDNAVAEWFASQPTLDLSDIHHPPHCLTCLTTTTGEVYCRLDISHTLVDASSVGIILSDLINAYEDALPAEGGSKYSAYVAFLDERNPQDDLVYWKEMLSTANPCLVPPQEPLHNIEHAQLARVSTQLEDLATIYRFRDAYGVSIASICQLAWALVLARQIGSTNVSFGNISSGRDAPIPKVEELVGPMINMLVCHVQLDWTAKVSDTARELQRQSVKAFDHQQTSLAAIQHELGLSRNQPLFNSTLSYKRQQISPISKQAGIIVDSLGSEDPTEYDINVNIDVAETGLELAIQYSTAAQSASAATRLAQNLVLAIRTVCENAELSLGQLNLLSVEDTAQICRWNSTVPKRLDRCVHNLVLDQMVARPDELAVSAWDGEMTYSEVNDASRRLAYHLAERGVGPDVMVGMCMDKSKLGVIAMLAILRAGGAVVPLGVQHPLARIEGIVEDIATPLILVDRIHEQRLEPLAARAQLLAIDSFLETAPATPVPTAEPCVSVGPEHVAWVIYTSGSTGRPKGVVLQHGSLATSIFYHGRRLDIQSHDRLLQFAAFTFDAAIQEIITALAFGASTCIPSEEDRMNRLTAYLAESRVTLATLTSTVAALVRPQETPSVRIMILMGEAVQPKVVDQWIEHATVINAYGPSECCIHSTCKKVADSSVSLHIGTAIAGATWIVNPRSIGQLVPRGAPGELLIGGPLLAREYLNDPVKTAAAFVTDPAFVRDLGLVTGQRMYRTGDLVRQTEDGTLVYLGRIDSQVKIRGQRVETGEIEYHIGKQKSVHEAVVLYVRQGHMTGRLIAAVVLGESSTSERHQYATAQRIPEEQREEARLRLKEVQQSLSQQVMHYMVPSIWIPLAAVPVNASGKTDRSTLTRWIQSLSPDEVAELNSTNSDTGDVDDQAATSVERQLRRIWSEVLSVPLSNITHSANFFSLGGDSITAMQVVSASRARGILLSVRKVLESQTIPQLAAKAQICGDTDHAARLPDGPFALSPIQQMYFNDIAADSLHAKGEHRYVQSVSLRSTRRIERSALVEALDVAVTKHAMLRARFRHSQTHGWEQWIEKELTGSYRFNTHVAADAESMNRTIAQSQATLDLEYGPVFTVDLFERKDRQVLHLAAHHLVIDLVSWRILLRDVEDLLVHQRVQNATSLAFPVWLERQRRSLSTLEIPNTLHFAVPKPNWDYWGLTPGQAIWGSLTSVQSKCDSDTTSLLFSSANTALKTEPLEILLAALFISFKEIFEDRPVPAVFTEGHGREATDDETDVSDTVGWFTTMTPLLPVLGTNGALRIVRQVKDQRRRIPGRGVPYFGSRFLTAHGQEAFAHHSPAEIVFNYTGRFQQTERDDALFHFNNDDDNTGAASEVGDLVKLFAALDVSVTVEADELLINVRFSQQARHQTAIQQWAQAYVNVISTLVHELIRTAPTATATDFPLMNLSDNDMAVVEKNIMPAIGLSSTNEIEDILPCSPLQQGILLTQLQSPSTYCIQQTCRVVASKRSLQPVNAEELIKAWHQVIARHSILRTILLEPLPGQEKFAQIVLREPSCQIIQVDGISDDVVADWLSSQPTLDLSDFRSPPHRLICLTTTTGNVYCRLDISHSLVDASSLALIIRDLIDAYGGTIQGGGSQYSAYITFLEQRKPQDNISYWNTLLNKAESCIVPLQNPPHEANNAQLAKVFTRFDNLAILHRFRDTHGVSIASICQLAWALVLARYTGSNNVSFGNLSSGRDVPIPGVDELVGPMINMLVCHLQLNWSASVSETARELQRQSIEAFDHQQVSLAAIQHELGLSRSQPLFNSTLSYKRQSPTSSDETAITIEGLGWEDPTEYDVNVGVDVTPTQLEINMQYSTAVLSEAAATRLVHNLVQAVRGICENTDQPLKNLRLLSPEDTAQLYKWNAIMPPRIERCVHELVQDRITAQPTASAICAWDGELTYAELDVASRRLAHHLAGCGVGPEVMVALCMDKSKWTIVAMLAILRAGGAVVPLGVGHPLGRIELIVKDISAPIVLVDRGHKQRLAALAAQVPLLAVDSFLEAAPVTQALTSEASTTVCPSVRPENVAWVIFTSGSTGKPKGVVLEHGSLVTSILAHAPLWGLSSSTRTLQFAAFTFDVSISDVFATLAFGGCVCSPSEDDRLSNLNQTTQAFQVTYANLTPTVARLLDPKQLPTLKTLVLIGEAVDAGVVHRWNKNAAVINGYGPAEASIVFHCSPPIQDPAAAANVGQKIAGGDWVVDPDNLDRLVPIGAPGELLIEGPLLSRGYLNDPIKTAAAFVTDPAFVLDLSLGPGRCMYRTGDMVQQNTDGSLTFLGRRDTQVKIRGQRVEIGEVESEIVRLLPDAKHAYVSKKGQVLVAVIESTTSDSNIEEAPRHSIITPDPEQQKRFESLQASLRDSLPRYMIPSAFLAINAFPLNDSGKMDRRSVGILLESIPSEKWLEYTAKSQVYQPPVGAMEQLLSELWTTCIGLENMALSRTNSFFDHGGDSITAMALIQQLRKRGLRLSVPEIFNYPVLSDMAKWITADIDESAQYKPFALVSQEERLSILENVLSDTSLGQELDVLDMLPTTDFQAQIIRENMEPERRQLNYFAFDAGGRCDSHRLTQAVSELVIRIEALRTGFARSSGQKFVQVVYAKWQPEVRIFQTNESLDSFCQRSLEQDMFAEPTLARPMFDVAIVVAKDQHRIVFRISHALYDGATLHQVWSEMEAIFAGDVKGIFIPVGSYFHSLQARTTQETEDHWRELLRGAVIPSVSGRTEPRVSRLGLLLSEPIKFSRSGQSDFTVAVAVKAAWAIVLSQHMATHDVVFAEISSGRSTVHPSVAGAVACCARAVPCRVAYEPEWTLQTLLEQIRQQQIDSMQNESLEFQQIAQRCMGWSQAEAEDLRVSMVNHQKASKQDMSLGATVYKNAFISQKDPYASVDFAIETVEDEHGAISASLAFAVDRIPDELARTLFGRFQDTLATILANRHCSRNHSITQITDMAASGRAPVSD